MGEAVRPYPEAEADLGEAADGVSEMGACMGRRD